MKLTTRLITSDKAKAVMCIMSLQIDRIEAHPGFPMGVYLTNQQANILQTNCSYRGHPIKVDA
jgi:hypothetical protein